MITTAWPGLQNLRTTSLKCLTCRTKDKCPRLLASQLQLSQEHDANHGNDNATFYDDAHVRPKSRGPWVDALLKHIPATSDVRLTSISE